MSMDSYIVNGYGFPVETVNGYDILKFLKNHAAEEKFDKLWGERGKKLFDIVKAISLDSLEYMKDKYFYELHNCDTDDMETLIDALSSISENPEDAMDVIAAIIDYELDGIEIAYEPGQSEECRGYASIIFRTGLPWTYSDREKQLTEEELNALFVPYAKELGIDSSEIGELEIEYFG